MAGRKMKEEGNSGRERGEGRADTCCLPHCLSSPSSSLSFCVSSSSSHSCFLPLLLLSFPPRSVWNNPRDPLAEEEGEPFGRGDDKTIGSVKGELTFFFFLFFVIGMLYFQIEERCPIMGIDLGKLNTARENRDARICNGNGFVLIERTSTWKMA